MSAPALTPLARFLLGLGLLTAFAALGAGLAAALHLPFPGSVLGMALLWLSLSLGWVRLEWLADAADGLLGALGLTLEAVPVKDLEPLPEPEPSKRGRPRSSSSGQDAEGET